MQYIDYKEILSSYSSNLPNTRYDSLQYYLKGRFEISDITIDKDVIDREYKSYNVYRKDITGETLSLKLNETRNDEDEVINTFYDCSLFDKEVLNTSVIYRFPGVVLSHIYASNNREMTLEDLFAEYYYEYILALDTSYLLNTNKTYYFNKESINNITQEIQPSGKYNILPVDSTYINEETQETERILYDGTYAPTVGELLEGNLYIVIQSPGMKPRKIQFNNTALPTLLLNDDKYKNSDIYILNNQQLLRLCDIKLYERVGFNVGWKQLISVSNIKTMIEYINSTRDPEDTSTAAHPISIGDVQLRLYYSAYYMNNGLPENQQNIYFITGNENIYIDQLAFQTIKFGSDLTQANTLTDTDDAQLLILNHNVFTGPYANPTIYSPYVKPIPGKDDHYIILHLFFTLTLVLKGFKESPSSPQPTPTDYEFSWWENTP